jgi:hypothetical protein
VNSAALPWTRAQRRLVTALNLGGGILIGTAWAGSGGTDTIRGQIAWLNLATVGAVIAAVADAAWLYYGRRAVGRRRRRVVPDLLPVAASAPVAVAAGGWVWLPGTRRVHRPGCVLVLGKRVVAVKAARISSERLMRCEVCGGESC